MQNDYNNKQAQTQTADKDKGSELIKSAVKHGEEKVKDFAGEAYKQLEQGQEQVGKIIGKVDKQLHENPWSVMISVALGSFLLGSLFGPSRRS